ncbi:MAG: hypothetical protein OXE94_00620 [Aestuariivita sp.]|nr:hypothetical protein [Aestuariivita sp.]MCY4201672.1 hypothetical protein [Aestuariivita sp.]MCY4287939.1 hypothetical protein [Aestuariivita sp.]MCY4348182.1 hypothetical protein [Aestuariivita sp.]
MELLSFLNPFWIIRFLKFISTHYKIRKIKQYAPNAKELKIEAWVQVSQQEFDNIPSELTPNIMFIIENKSKE